jgi:uncharacterized membrane protein
MKRLARGLFVLTPIVLIVWIGWTSPTLNECLSHQYENYSGNTFQEKIASLYVFLVGSRLCIGEFIHASGEGIIAIFTVILGVATWFLWRATRNLVEDARATGASQLNVTKTAADAAKTSADASLVALRPWLSCEVKAVGPLKFSKGDAVFKFSFIVTNVGHSPAMQVSLSPRITVLNSPYGQAIVWLKKIAEFNREFPVKTTTILIPSGENFGGEEIGLVLFPNESHPFNYILRIKRDEIEKSCEDLKLSKTSKYIMPIVCGLVTYNYPLAKVRADTGFVYPIRRKTGQTRDVFYLNKSVPQNNIVFDTDFSGQGFAT